MKLYLAHTKEYKAFIQQYIDGLKKMKKLIAYDSTQDRLATERKEIENGLLKTYNKLKDETISKNTDRMREIEKAHKNTKNVYSDPQTEILRRQDFDLRISMMTLDDVIVYLDDDTRDVSDYELLKIKSLYGDSVKVAELLAVHREKRDTDYLQDGEYKELSNDVDILRHIKSMGLTMVYIPVGEKTVSANGTKIPTYKTYDFSFIGRKFGKGEIDPIINELESLLEQIKPLKTRAEIIGGLSFQHISKTKKYPDFESRIFKGSKDYDERIRFEWLKERFNDTTTDRFNPRRDDYDIIKHIAFMEGRLAAKLRNDAGYRERYRENMVKYTEQEDITTTVFSFTTGEYWGL